MKVLSNVTQTGLDNHRKFGNLTARDARKNVVARMKLDNSNRQAMARQLGQLRSGTAVSDLESPVGDGGAAGVGGITGQSEFGAAKCGEVAVAGNGAGVDQVGNGVERDVGMVI